MRSCSAAAVVVTHAGPVGVVTRCVESLHRAGGLDRIIIVDNGDLARRINQDGCEVVRAENRGYGAAANLGFSRAGSADAVVLLNDDVIVRPGWLEPLLREVDAAAVGAVQPKLVADGRIASLGVTIGPDGAGVDIGDGEPDVQGGAPSDIGIFTGGAVMFSAGFLRSTGGFDERYFLYYEDVDLALRGAELGWKYLVVPESVVEHERGTTTSAMPDRTRYLQERNRLWTAFRFADASTVGRAVWLSVRRLRYEPRGVHARALATGVVGGIARLGERHRVQRSSSRGT